MPESKQGNMSSEVKSEENLREETGTFLQKNFPQIEMHGGSAAIQNLDRESGEVSTQLGGCVQRVRYLSDDDPGHQNRVVNEIAEIETVHANTGGGSGSGHGGKSPSFPGETTDSGESDGDDEPPTAPF